MKVGDRILFTADWSSFLGMHGNLTQVEPFFMATIGDDPRPLRVGEREFVPDAEPAHLAGAE